MIEAFMQTMHQDTTNAYEMALAGAWKMIEDLEREVAMLQRELHFERERDWREYDGAYRSHYA